jgi:hypothetical protein
MGQVPAAATPAGTKVRPSTTTAPIPTDMRVTLSNMFCLLMVDGEMVDGEPESGGQILNRG